MLHALRVGIASHAACGMLSVIYLSAYQPPEQFTAEYDGIREVDMLTVYRLYWYMILGPHTDPGVCGHDRCHLV